MKLNHLFPPDARPISEAQAKRLYAIAGQANWDSEELHDWLLETYGREHVGDITRDEYDHICHTLGADEEEDS